LELELAIEREDDIRYGTMTASERVRNGFFILEFPKFKKDSDGRKFLAYAEDKNFIDVIGRKHTVLPGNFDGDLTLITKKKGRNLHEAKPQNCAVFRSSFSARLTLVKDKIYSCFRHS
jgi:hypothetical protein